MNQFIILGKVQTHLLVESECFIKWEEILLHPLVRIDRVRERLAQILKSGLRIHNNIRLDYTESGTVLSLSKYTNLVCHTVTPLRRFQMTLRGQVRS